MKKSLLFALAAVLAAGLLVFTACGGGGGGGDNPPDYGENLITEEAILAATGTGIDSVEKEGNGYRVTGTVTAVTAYNGDFNRIQLSIPADPEDSDMYFKNANRYVIRIQFPNSAVKPYDTYTDGFRIYLDNNQGTDTTPIWGGTWQREWPDEFEALGNAVGTININRDLTIDPDDPESESNVGDYQNFTIVLGFDDEDLGKEYSFVISNVAVYGDGIDNTYPAERPVIHETSVLVDAIYELNDTADDLTVVVAWSDNSATFTYQWYSNDENSNEGGTIIDGETNLTFTPPTDVVGLFYYYMVATYPAEETSASTRAVRVRVLPETIELNAEYFLIDHNTFFGKFLLAANGGIEIHTYADKANEIMDFMIKHKDTGYFDLEFEGAPDNITVFWVIDSGTDLYRNMSAEGDPRITVGMYGAPSKIQFDNAALDVGSVGNYIMLFMEGGSRTELEKITFYSKDDD